MGTLVSQLRGRLGACGTASGVLSGRSQRLVVAVVSKGHQGVACGFLDVSNERLVFRHGHVPVHAKRTRWAGASLGLLLALATELRLLAGCDAGFFGDLRGAASAWLAGCETTVRRLWLQTLAVVRRNRKACCSSDRSGSLARRRRRRRRRMPQPASMIASAGGRGVVGKGAGVAWCCMCNAGTVHMRCRCT